MPRIKRPDGIAAVARHSRRINYFSKKFPRLHTQDVMPRMRKKPAAKKPVARKYTRRKRRGGGQKLSIQRGPFPANRVVKMHYLEHLSLDPTALQPLQEYPFRANSVYDPDPSLGGHQPMGYDQWGLFYKQFTVIGSSITVQGTQSTTGSNPCVFGVRTSATSSLASLYNSFIGLLEDPRVSYRWQQSAVNGNVARPARATFSAKKWFNISDVKDNQGELGAVYGSNPTVPVYFIVFASPMDASTDIPPITLLIRINQIVLLSEPLDLPQS